VGTGSDASSFTSTRLNTSATARAASTTTAGRRYQGWVVGRGRGPRVAGLLVLGSPQSDRTGSRHPLSGAEGPDHNTPRPLHLLAGWWLGSCPTCGSNWPRAAARTGSSARPAAGPARSVPRWPNRQATGGRPRPVKPGKTRECTSPIPPTGRTPVTARAGRQPPASGTISSLWGRRRGLIPPDPAPASAWRG
jgi:hypothetical protein